MDEKTLEKYWSELPVGSANAATYEELCARWNKSERDVRSLLHDLSAFDNGDDFILIRSSKKKGFYKTDDAEEIIAYKQECLSKGKSVFAPVRKCNRVLRANTTQYSLVNNLRVVRESLAMKQSDVVWAMKDIDPHFDKPMLSRMENSYCIPTPQQLSALSVIYGCAPEDLIDTGFYF